MSGVSMRGLHPVVAQVLVARGYREEELEAFLRPCRAQLYDPWLMSGMEEAVCRVERAIRQKHRVRVYGDYDVDGVCSVALVSRVLGSCGLEVDHYIPDRHKEGYGVSLAGVEDAYRDGVELMIALDCGSSDLEAARLARRRGIDLIICDHHLLGEELPECSALLNPKQLGCGYPQKELSAAAVGFKLVSALAERHLVDEEVPWSVIDLVALSLVADQVPLVHEARLLLSEGLHCLQSRPQLGLSVLMGRLGYLPSCIDSEFIAFRIAPLLNAAGRMAHAGVALELLLSEDKSNAEELTSTLFDLNNRRKAAQEEATEEAFRQLEQMPLGASSSFLYHRDWHPGVLGIVAARSLEAYPRPTLVLTEVEGRVVGSMRSVDPVDAREALEAAAHLLQHFGGHRYAAGCSLEPDHLKDLQDVFTAHIEEKVKNTELSKELWIDLSLNPSQVDWPLYKALEALEPYGKGNPRPVFAASDLRAVPGSVKVLRAQHLRCRVAASGRSIMLIGFGMAASADALSQGAPFHMAYSIEENTFNGQKELRFHIQDLIFD